MYSEPNEHRSNAEADICCRLAKVVGGTDTPEARKKILGTIPLGRVVGFSYRVCSFSLILQFSVNQKMSQIW